MLFTSLEFLIFLVSTLLVYYSVPTKKMQLITVTIASCIFYAWNHLPLLLLLIFSILVNYYVVLCINNEHKRGKIYATLGVTINLIVLSIFKYSGLIATSLNIQNGDIGSFMIAIPLPIGISFYTFQGISLVVDSYRGKVTSSNPQKSTDSFIHYFHYISFFPQLVAGPIVKARTFLPQITKKDFKNIRWDYCFKLITLGYFLKMVVADNLKNYTFWMEYPFFDNKATITLFSYLFGYSMQIFADFEGYSLIAIGIAGLFGYHLPKNFNFPYIAKSFSDFWRRWHISLSSFLKEYLYIPLGGNKNGKVRTYFNLFITMFLGGLWHGAA
jgi:alginate O-acetyltransferase complex protein AlgI